VLIVVISIPAAVSELLHSFVPNAFISVKLFAAAKYNIIQFFVVNFNHVIQRLQYAADPAADSSLKNELPNYVHVYK